MKNFLLKGLGYILICITLIGCANTKTSSSNKAVLTISKSSVVTNDNYKIAILPFKYEYIAQHSRLGKIEVPINAGEIVAKYVETALLNIDRFKLVDRQYLTNINR